MTREHQGGIGGRSTLMESRIQSAEQVGKRTLTESLELDQPRGAAATRGDGTTRPAGPGAPAPDGRAGTAAIDPTGARPRPAGRAVGVPTPRDSRSLVDEPSQREGRHVQRISRAVPFLQLKGIGPPLQQRAADRAGGGHDSVTVHEAAQRGIATPASPLPHAEAIQRSFGHHDISAIQAHVGTDAAASSRAMGAQAYATGNHVVLGGASDLHTVAHEAAHVVQQRGGVQLSGGIGNAGDPHEQHADAVADRVARGESAEALLDAHAGGGGTASTGAVQRQIFASEQDKKAGKPLGSGALEDELLNEFDARGHMDEFLEILESNTRHYTVEELREHLRSLPMKARPPAKPREPAPGKTEERRSSGATHGEHSHEVGPGESKEAVVEAKVAPQSREQQRDAIEAHMGQGVSGNLKQYNLYSGSFSSCVPIVMFNASTSRAGLFHLPQGELAAQQDVLLDMAGDISPTEIRICKGGHYSGLGATLVDRRLKDTLDAEGRELRDFFMKRLPKELPVEVINSNESFGWLTVSLTPSGGMQLSKGVRRGNQFDLKDQEAPDGARRFQRPDWKYDKSVEF